MDVLELSGQVTVAVPVSLDEKNIRHPAVGMSVPVQVGPTGNAKSNVVPTVDVSTSAANDCCMTL